MRRVALVTGGTRGIGLGIARALAGKGFDLAVNGVREEGAVRTALEELRSLGVDAEYVRGDVGEPADRERLVSTLRERFGRLHILVNNAGVAPSERADLLEAGEESFDRLMKINLKGPHFLTQSIARWLVEQRRANPDHAACIVNVTSISATVASTNRGEYCISKAGLAMVSQLWAVRLAEHGIPVYEVRPGIIRTDMTAGVAGKYDALIEGGLVPERRWGTPEDVGRAVAALAEGEMPYATGSVLVVDGGLTLPRL
jgi:NAD(P)-dependent dehydrogenase (short-subunit alcohol dehydrogenase family)